MIWKAPLALMVIAWVALSSTGSGVLIGSEQKRLQGDGQYSLVCRYFIATSVIEKTFWYAPNGFMGKAACPRLIRI